MNWKTLLMSAMVMGAVSVVAEKVKLDDELEKADAWKMNKNWKMEKDVIIGSTKGSSELLLKKKITFKEVEFEAEITPIKVIGKSWKMAGLRIQMAGDKYWQMALIERPDTGKSAKTHCFELKEKQGKVWGAERKLKRLSNKQAKWEYGKTYKLKIKVTKTRIDGIAFDAKGKEISRFAYALTSAAVIGGSPALKIGRMEAKFDDIEVEGEK